MSQEVITRNEFTACINTLLDVDDVLRPTITDKQRDAITTVITLLQDMRRALPVETAASQPADSGGAGKRYVLTPTHYKILDTETNNEIGLPLPLDAQQENLDRLNASARAAGERDGGSDQ
jgi:hypothetical protein